MNEWWVRNGRRATIFLKDGKDGDGPSSTDGGGPQSHHHPRLNLWLAVARAFWGRRSHIIIRMTDRCLEACEWRMKRMKKSNSRKSPLMDYTWNVKRMTSKRTAWHQESHQADVVVYDEKEHSSWRQAKRGEEAPRARCVGWDDDPRWFKMRTKTSRENWRDRPKHNRKVSDNDARFRVKRVLPTDVFYEIFYLTHILTFNFCFSRLL